MKAKKQKKQKTDAGLGSFWFSVKPFNVKLAVIVLDEKTMISGMANAIKYRYESNKSFRNSLPDDFIEMDMPDICTTAPCDGLCRHMFLRKSGSHILFVLENHISVDVIAHEALHSIIALTQIDLLSAVDSNTNEVSAYLLSNIVESVIIGMIDIGCRPRLFRKRPQGPVKWKNGRYI